MDGQAAVVARWRGEHSGLDVAQPPVRLSIPLDPVPARDGHEVCCALSLSVRAVDRPADRAMLQETFGCGDVTGSQVVAHLSHAVAGPGRTAIASADASEWLEDRRAALLQALASAAAAAAFACGLEVLPPLELSLSSPSLERRRVDELGRQIAGRRHDDQSQQLRRASELLGQFASLRESAPGITAGQVLEQVGPTDREALLRSLFQASASQAPPTIVVVAGPSLAQISGDQPPLVVDLPTALGPLRSVGCGLVSGQRRLLVGARSGVLVVDPAEPQAATLYSGGETASAFGFSSAAVAGDQLWACHGELGIVSWNLADSDRPARRIAPTSSPARHLRPLSAGQMVYSCGRSVCLLSVDGKADVLATLPADAAGLLVTDRHLVAAAKDGHVTVCQRQTLETVSSHRCASGITSLGSVPWIGDQRVLLATADGPVLCVGLEDSALTHYTSGHRGLCDVTGGPGVIAALSPDRQRLVSWLTWQNDRPRELHVASLLRHRAAGLCIA